MEATKLTTNDNTQFRLDSQAGEAGLLKYLSFTVDSTEYAFDALRIKEIIEYASVTRIPMVPAYIRGVTNLRGSVVPVIDLAARLGKRPSPITRRTCIIIVEVVDDGEKTNLGVVIDAINEVFNLGQSQIEPTPNFGAGIPAKFISGMGKVGDRFVILMNTDQVLSIPELARLEGDILTVDNDADDKSTSLNSATNDTKTN